MILIVTGPCGAGKTSIAKIVAKRYGCEHVSGDEVKKELFPEIKWITDHPEKLKILKEEIFNRSLKLVDSGKNVVVDYIMTAREELEKYKNVFGEKLVIKILLPKIELVWKRDHERDCWTAGKESIEKSYVKFENLKSFLEEDCFIDNQEKTAEETVEKYFDQRKLKLCDEMKNEVK